MRQLRESSAGILVSAICEFVFAMPLFEFAAAFVNMIRATSWEPVEARVMSAQLESSDNLSIAVGYEYEREGKTFHGDRYMFIRPGLNSTSSLPPELEVGRAIRVYVNPSHPTESVVVRIWTWDGLWVLLFLFLFVSCSTYSIVCKRNPSP